ncbi:hypothetical protein U91I_01925 [alpha proteobacterium U9-1i]|nr:hypothetical protein U91I_01925 [alpha proteobacterium U9-1i]
MEQLALRGAFMTRAARSRPNLRLIQARFAPTQGALGVAHFSWPKFASVVAVVSFCAIVWAAVAVALTKLG